MKQLESSPETKNELLNAALAVIRSKGYSATTVDDICRKAGVSKGSFFHYFPSKEHLAIAAAEHFANMAGGLFATAPYRTPADPLERLLGYVDFRTAILRGEIPDFTCLLGTMVQEAYESNPAIRQACDKHISEHAADVALDIAQARQRYAPDAQWTAESLGLFTQAVIQGAFILAKAKHGPEVAADCLQHLRRYLELLFSSSSNTKE
jgi:TetR/AcrR family transcriptional repressor of nem operon